MKSQTSLKTLAALITLAAPAHAAITWAAPAGITADSEISKNGEFDRAYNFGAGDTGTTVANGVTFTNTGSSSGTYTPAFDTGEVATVTGAHSFAVRVGAGSTSGDPKVGSFVYVTGRGGGGNAPFNTLGTGYQSLLNESSNVGSGTSGNTAPPIHLHPPQPHPRHSV